MERVPFAAWQAALRNVLPRDRECTPLVLGSCLDPQRGEPANASGMHFDTACLRGALAGNRVAVGPSPCDRTAFAARSQDG